jgi:malonyl-CoA O-methyltransferase
VTELGRLLGLTPLPRLQPRDGYALWAETYPPHAHNPLMQAEEAVVAPILASIAPARALDVGTGTGRNLALLAASGARLVVGVDLSMSMLQRTAADARRACADACRLPFPDRAFDLVCSSLMAGDVEHLGGWVREATRVLAPGGHLVYSDFHPAWTVERWRRTFRTADGRTFELAYFPHAIEEHLRLLAGAALAVRTIREPRVPGRSSPVVVVFHAVKPGRRERAAARAAGERC